MMGCCRASWHTRTHARTVVFVSNGGLIYVCRPGWATRLSLPRKDTVSGIAVHPQRLPIFFFSAEEVGVYWPPRIGRAEVTHPRPTSSCSLHGSYTSPVGKRAQDELSTALSEVRPGQAPSRRFAISSHALSRLAVVDRDDTGDQLKTSSLGTEFTGSSFSGRQ